MAETTKRKRFTKVATKRVQKIIDYLTLLQNCSNRNNYEYDEYDEDYYEDDEYDDEDSTTYENIPPAPAEEKE